jgi:hypothetical protein
VNYYTNGISIRFHGPTCSGIMSQNYTGPEMDAYLAWVAEGNTAEEWKPDYETPSPS